VRVLDAFMTALFVLSIAVQYNDPDPLYWMAVYTPPALLSGMALAGRFRARPTALAFAVYLVLALYHLPAFKQATLASFDSFHMHSIADEEVREAGGVWLCAIWTGVLALRGRRALA
jgi:transmembrane protein TMEM220